MPEDLLELAVEAFDTPPRDQETIDAEVLSVNVDGFEGPLDLLLTLARTQRMSTSSSTKCQRTLLTRSFTNLSY